MGKWKLGSRQEQSSSHERVLIESAHASLGSTLAAKGLFRVVYFPFQFTDDRASSYVLTYFVTRFNIRECFLGYAGRSYHRGE